MQHRTLISLCLTLLVSAAALAGCLAEAPGPLRGSHADAAARLSGASYPDLVVEIDYIADAKPDERSIQFVLDELRNVTTKRDIIVIGPTEEASEPRTLTERRVWTAEAIGDAHESMLDRFEPGETASGDAAYLHVMFLGGVYRSGSRDAIGVWFGSYLAVCIERPTIGEVPVYTDESYLDERAVFLHEVGHALGLVNNGAPVSYDRVAEDGIHSTQPESVMSYAVEYVVDTPALQAVPRLPDRFDQYDLADLAALHELAEQDAARRR